MFNVSSLHAYAAFVQGRFSCSRHENSVVDGSGRIMKPRPWARHSIIVCSRPVHRERLRPWQRLHPRSYCARMPRTRSRRRRNVVRGNIIPPSHDGDNRDSGQRTVQDEAARRAEAEAIYHQFRIHAGAPIIWPPHRAAEHQQQMAFLWSQMDQRWGESRYMFICAVFAPHLIHRWLPHFAIAIIFFSATEITIWENINASALLTCSLRLFQPMSSGESSHFVLWINKG